MCPWGDEDPASLTNWKRIQAKEELMPPTTPVRLFPANSYGIYDMSGNVWEYCWNHYDKNAYRRDQFPTVDPKKPGRGGELRVSRGGSAIFRNR